MNLPKWLFAQCNWWSSGKIAWYEPLSYRLQSALTQWTHLESRIVASHQFRSRALCWNCPQSPLLIAEPMSTAPHASPHTLLFCSPGASLSLLRHNMLQDLLSPKDPHGLTTQAVRLWVGRWRVFLVLALVLAGSLLIYSSLRGSPLGWHRLWHLW